MRVDYAIHIAFLILELIRKALRGFAFSEFVSELVSRTPWKWDDKALAWLRKAFVTSVQTLENIGLPNIPNLEEWIQQVVEEIRTRPRKERETLLKDLGVKLAVSFADGNLSEEEAQNLIDWTNANKLRKFELANFSAVSNG